MADQRTRISLEAPDTRPVASTSVHGIIGAQRHDHPVGQKSIDLGKLRPDVRCPASKKGGSSQTKIPHLIAFPKLLAQLSRVGFKLSLHPRTGGNTVSDTGNAQSGFDGCSRARHMGQDQKDPSPETGPDLGWG